METKGDPIWINDFNQLIRQDRLMDFIPKPNMAFSEKVNSIVRLSIYAGIILGLLHNNYLYIYIPIVVMVTTYLVYMFQSDKTKEDFHNSLGECYRLLGRFEEAREQFQLALKLNNEYYSVLNHHYQ
jgi:tetratricopeptide (TPR) repeat protein